MGKEAEMERLILSAKSRKGRLVPHHCQVLSGNLHNLIKGGGFYGRKSTNRI